MESIKGFIQAESQRLERLSAIVKQMKEPETPHEYVILNNAWVKGETNMLDKLKKFVEEYEARN